MADQPDTMVTRSDEPATPRGYDMTIKTKTEAKALLRMIAYQPDTSAADKQQAEKLLQQVLNQRWNTDMAYTVKTFIGQLI